MLSLFRTSLAFLLLPGCNPGASDGYGKGGIMADEGQIVGTTSLAELQVQPPEPIVYAEAGSGGIHIKENTLFCSVTVADADLRQALDLPSDISLGIVNSVFFGATEASGVSEKRLGETLPRTAGVKQSSSDLQRRYYQERCAWTPDNIYINTAIGMNAAGEPYRITVTLRQADREWTRVVERTDDKYPWRDPPLPYDITEYAIKEDLSRIGEDIRNLLGRNT